MLSCGSAACWQPVTSAAAAEHSLLVSGLHGRCFTTLQSLTNFSTCLHASAPHAAKYRLVCSANPENPRNGLSYRHKIKRSELLEDNWPDKLPQGSIDWGAFWSGEDFLEIKEDLGPEELEELELDASQEEQLKLQFQPTSDSFKPARDVVRDRFADFEKREDYIRPEPIPMRKQYFPEIPPPEPKDSYYENFNALDLRAIVEKRRERERLNAEWKQRMDEVGTTCYLNLTPKTDYRLQRFGEEHRDWSHDEIMNLISNNGQSADPYSVRIGVNNPEGRLDYFEQGVKWIDETEDFLAKLGHWREDVAELQHDPDIATLDSAFANFDETGAEVEADAPEAQDSVPSTADEEDQGSGDAEDGSLEGYF